MSAANENKVIAAFDEAWLGQVREAALDSGLPIIDPHHHLWERGRRYLTEEMLDDAACGHRIVATVFCQSEYAYRIDGPDALRPVGETERMVLLSEQADRAGTSTRVCAGIVGYADLTLAEGVLPVLQAHIDAGKGRFRGVRHAAASHPAFQRNLPDQPPAGLLAESRLRRGLAQLQRLGLSFEAWVYHPQLPEALDLARAMPDLNIVLNHFGGPLAAGPYRGKRAEVFPEWRAGMRALAGCPNVSVKLGGLGMLIGGFDFHKRELPPDSIELAAAFEPYVDTCIEFFGADRCMFESNFPVDKAMFSYGVLWNAYKRLTEGASAHEKRLLFKDTAARVYRLSVD